MTPEELQELEALAARIKDLPWSWEPDDYRDKGVKILAADGESWIIDVENTLSGYSYLTVAPDDLEYIITACNLAPALIAALRTARVENERLAAAIKAHRLNVWGDTPVEHYEDVELYKVVDGGQEPDRAREARPLPESEQSYVKRAWVMAKFDGGSDK